MPPRQGGSPEWAVQRTDGGFGTIEGEEGRMKYRGRVRNGVVVLEQAARLAEGTTVEVRAVSSKNGGVGRRKRARNPRVGTAAAILPHVGTWAGDPAEMDRLLGELRRMKEAEVAAKKAALAGNAGRGAPTGGRRRSPPAPQRKRAS
jgi:hypothetical protein